MNLSLAYSPCPNDTFAFHAMVNNLVDCEGLSFSVDLADVEQLNIKSTDEQYDICKMSYHAFFYVCDRYVMLRSGSALGYNNGPLFVSGKEFINGKNFSDFNIAIPGEMTTGALLLRIAYPECKKLTPIVFSDIEERVLSGEFDAGVLIHEGRFTYRKKGLKLIKDLGMFWQNSTGMPIPLGGIAVSRKLDNELQHKINRVLRRSIEFAIHNPLLSKSYVCENAQEMEYEIQKKHIELFVNNNTIDIGQEGVDAVYSLYNKALETNSKIIKRDNLFIL